MARPLNPLGSLGAKVASALADDAGERERAIEKARRAFAIQSLQTQRARPRRAAVFALAAAAVLALGVISFSLLHRAAPLAFEVDGKAGFSQTWLAAPSARPLVLSFSDGTVLDVASSARARVLETTANGANISLESGSIQARVVHTSHSAWGLIAGPFAVRVTGTRFNVQWEPAAQKFVLAVSEGSVVVSGSIAGSERPVRAGERLVASVARGQLELTNTANEAATNDGGPSGVATVDSAGTEAAAPPTAESASAPSQEVTAPRESSGAPWRELVRKGDLRQAFAAAESHGFQNACDLASAAELLSLGDGARLSGRSDRAIEALLTLRKRYPHDSRRAPAAFALGKVAFDQQHAYGQAAAWFATCMREQPNGPLAREAGGRQIEALRNAGDLAGAEQAARAYLSRYPDGPHADVARSLLK